MERAQHDPAVGQRSLDAVAEARPRPEPHDPGQRLVCEGAERHVDAGVTQGGELPFQDGWQVSRSAGVGLFGGGAQRTAAVM